MAINEDKIMDLIEKVGKLTGRIDEYVKAHGVEHDQIDTFMGDQRKINEKTIKLWSGVIVVMGVLNFISVSIAVYVALR